MDQAKKFKPKTILLWREIETAPEAQRIIKLFPSAVVNVIKHQRIKIPPNITAGKALRDGKKILMIGQTSSFVGHFDGQLGHSLCCCPYYKLVPLSNGCPYYCTYCYLAFVYRKYAPFIKLNINYETMFRQIRKAASKTAGRADFNMGEMLDSLALDHITNLTVQLVPFFAEIHNAYLMLLTKSSNIDNLLSIKSNDHTVVSWSLNPQCIIDKYEPGTASLHQRIEAAKICKRHGYRIRFRIDPGIIYLGWENDYVELVNLTLSTVQPENITIGMLRLLPGHKRLAIEAYGNRGKHLASQKLVETSTDDKLRYDTKQRIKFYNLVIDAIGNSQNKVSVSLCRETSVVWNALKNRCQPNKCNCITW